MENKVYLLQHCYDIDDEYDDNKILGIFSSYEKAKEVIERYKNIEGFKKYKDCFYIDEYVLDKKFWEKGFFKDSWDKEK